ncbi:MAG: trypsin-like peptidase domain-containing protein [Patescibacteria group bacterium]|nr:trypsin-like peptidase domain-containing protein [Patescibacteria group bacterium]
MRKIIAALGLAAVLLAAGAYGAYRYVSKQNQNQAKDYNQKIALLQSQLSSLRQDLAQISSTSQATAISAQELANRQQIIQKSQDQELTDAVAKVAPAVVSIIISKDVPQYQVTYVNPFGDDPFFKDFGVQMPVYKQVGSQMQKVGAGTGFLITSDGFILTNRHVVDDSSASYTALLSSGKQLPVTVIYRDQSNDIAIVKVSGSNFPTVSLGDSSGLKLGQAVAAIGNALGEYNNSVSTGVVSGLDRSIQASDQSGGSTEQLTGVIQTDAAINPGNSGGPLLDLNGYVIGIDVATALSGQNIGFAIPINQVKQVVKTVIGKNI